MTKRTHFVCGSDVNLALGRTHGKLPKNRNLLKFKTNHFCFDDKQGFLNRYTKFKARFIFEPISSSRKLQRRTLKLVQNIEFLIAILNVFQRRSKCLTRKESYVRQNVTEC